jgi:hypothetical protein
LLLHFGEIGNIALCQLRYRGFDLRRAEIARIDHAQAVHWGLGHDKRYHAFIDLLLGNADQYRQIARAVIGAFQGVACALHFRQVFFLTEIRIDRLLHDRDGQQCRSLDAVFEYVEFRLLRVRDLHYAQQPASQPTRQQRQAPHSSFFFHYSSHSDTSATSTRLSFLHA